ncbi:MAG: sigma-70 family RNA polymerase sigma factor [Planctomycetota bacterium]
MALPSGARRAARRPARRPGLSADALAPWPGVVAELGRRGVRLELAAGAGREERENHLSTLLMVLFRDTGAPETFEALYAVSEAGVRRWIRGLLGPGLAHLDAGEVLQDTFVNVYRYASGFRAEQEDSFRVWVRTIAGNIVRRSSGRRARFSFQELPEGLQEPEDRSEGPELALVRDEQAKSLRQAWVLFLCLYACAWAQLSPRDQKTLHLVEVENRSYREAGQILGVGRSNMKMIVFRSRKRIARFLRAALSAGRARTPAAGAA